MGKKLKGITIEIGGDTTKLGQALEDVNKKTSDLTGELKGVNSLLKMDPSNVTLLAQKQDILNGAIGETKKKLDTLKKAQEQVQKQFERGEIGADQYRDFQREIIATEKKLSGLESELKDTEDATKKAGKSAKESGEGFTVMKGAVADLASEAIQSAVGAIGDLIGSLFELTEATEEYRAMQAKIEGSANSFGYSMDFANGKYQEFYKYLGDDQMATNAITNLMGLGTSTESLTSLAEGAIGVWASYGDSIPIEALTESINETIRVGKVTGGFADTINWAKTSNEGLKNALSGNSGALKAFESALKKGETAEDAFNAGLAKITDTQERADVVAKFLNNTYGESKKAYDDTASSILQANEAELKLKETQAQIGEKLAPVNTKFTELKTRLLELLVPVLDSPVAMGALAGVLTALAGAIGVLTVATISMTVAKLAENSAWLASPITWIILGIVAVVGLLVGAFVALWNKSEGFRNFFINMWENIKSACSAVVDWFKNAWSSTIDWLKNAVAKIKEFFANAWNGIKSVFSNSIIGAYFQAIWNTIKGVFAVVKNVLSGNWSEAWNAIKSIVSGWANYFSTIWNAIKNVFASVGSWFSTKFTEAKNKIISVFSGIKEKFLTIGKNVVEGIWSGISNGYEWIKGKIKKWVGNVVDFCKSILGIKSPSRLFRDEIGRMIPLGMAQGIDDTKDQVTNSINELVTDTRTEVQKVTDEMNAKLLDSEIKYQKASERLKDSKKDSDKKYLEALKKTAEEERKIYDARVKDFENLKKKMGDAIKALSEETLQSLDEIEKAQEKFADKLKDFGSLTSTTKFSDGVNDFEVVGLADIEAQTQYLQEYYDLLVAVKERGSVPSEFMTILQDMGIEEGRTFAETLLGADDEAFNKYIEDWKIKQETADKLSKLMYEDKVDDLIDVSQEKFDDLTSKFLLIGESAGKEFENGFLPQILATVNEAISHISRAFASAKLIESATVITSTVDSVPKMARGGVLEKGQVGFLEGDGAEAVVPLERNTGWINSIADRLNNRMSNNPTESDGALLSKLDKIYDRLDRLQVVLDSGAVVGGIIDGVDSKLNEREMLALRGV